MKFLTKAKISPEFVLAVIRDNYRQQLQYDPEAEPNIDLNFNTAISEWRIACDLLGWRGLGKALGKEWNIKTNDSQWKELLEPADKKNLGDLCKFIATNTRKKRDVTQPIVLLGSPCLTASTFFAIRYYLARAGVDVSKLRPTSLLEPYVQRYPEAFLGPIAQLAPEKLPLIEIKNPLQDVFTGLVLLGMLLTMLGGVLTIFLRDFVVLILFLAIIVSGFGVLGIFTFSFLSKTKFIGVKTFKDLVKVLRK